MTGDEGVPLVLFFLINIFSASSPCSFVCDFQEIVGLRGEKAGTGKGVGAFCALNR
jgi:hypothetical protein